MNELCECHAMATRRCDCGTPMCERCFKRTYACTACLEKFRASTDESDAAQLAAWLKEQGETSEPEDDPMFAPADPCDCEQCWLCAMQREQAISDTADWLAEMSMEQ